MTQHKRIAAPALTAAHVRAFAAMPTAADRIAYSGTMLTIPDRVFLP